MLDGGREPMERYKRKKGDIEDQFSTIQILHGENLRKKEYRNSYI